jgi:Nif-specific regulatory protein
MRACGRSRNVLAARLRGEVELVRSPSCLARLPAELRGDILEALNALGRTLAEDIDPQHALDEVSKLIRSWVPHDRLVLCSLSEDGRTFTIFAEQGGPVGPLHAGHYTTEVRPSGRHKVDRWGIAPVFTGHAIISPDLLSDPRFNRPDSGERPLLDAGLRSGIAAPLQHGGQVVGALVATSITRGVHSSEHLSLLTCLAEVLAPLVQGSVLLQRERIRHQRLKVIERLTTQLSGTLDLRGAFQRIAPTVRAVLDFDTIGVVLVGEGGTEIVSLVEVDHMRPDVPPPERMPAAEFTIAAAILAGQPLILDDASEQLSSNLDGDRWIRESGARSLLCLPLWMGERVGGVLYLAKKEARWYDQSDLEVARGVAFLVALTLQHQRLAEEHRRLAATMSENLELKRSYRRLKEAYDARYGFDRILGQSSQLHLALEGARKVAPTETTVLITGESGTGKELVARAIHHESPRAEGPFVALNCAALPESLLESELFGHEKGAFTGADRARPGRIEAAAGGTLFLDEVGELSPTAQAKLLRVLQEREFTRVGSSQTQKADVRIVAATNRDLTKEVGAGRYREDLYYRLAVFTVHLPPLRERGEDVLILAERFLRELEGSMGRAGELTREARQALLAYSWPGNIRELSNAIERAMILSGGEPIRPEMLGLHAASPVPAESEAPDSGSLTIPELERRMVLDALFRSGGNRSRAARLLGITRSQLYTRLKRLGLGAEGETVQ